VIVVGLGNAFRHDDAAGLVAAHRLRNRGIPAEQHEGDLATLMDVWRGADALILIDAVTSGAAPGTVFRLDVSSSPLNRDLFKSSTHALGLADAVELSRTLGTLPARVLVFGVEVRDLSAGVGLSADVAGALPALLDDVVKSCAMLPSR
jgi:hydrogenase maturation protease